MKIDAEELIKRIQQLDPFWQSGVTIKWKIIKIIKQLAEEEKERNT